MRDAQVSYDGQLDEFQTVAEAAAAARRHAYFGDTCRTPDMHHAHDAEASAITIISVDAEWR